MMNRTPQPHAFVLALLVLIAAPRAASPAGKSPADSVRYGSPIDLPLAMSATFGEYRPGHFHAGVDFSTGGREGIPVLAIDDGQVVRVRASALGYGRSIYLRTRSGQLAVYGHLSSFMPELARYVEAVQDSLGRYRVDLTPPAGRFPVKKGQVLGRSGSSGAGPPHFHFEMREGDIAINPLGEIRVPDRFAPQLFALHVIPLEARARVNGTRERARIAFSPKAGQGLAATPPITIEGRVGLSVQGYDRAEAPADNHLGIYHLELWVDGERVFSSKYDRFDYLRNHEVEAQYDYEEVLRGRRSVAHLFVPAGVVGDFYDGLPAGAGVLYGGASPSGERTWPGERVLAPGDHPLKIVAGDAAGNQLTVSSILRVLETGPGAIATESAPATPADSAAGPPPHVKLLPDGRMADLELDFLAPLAEPPLVLVPGVSDLTALGAGRFRVRIDATGLTPIPVSARLPRSGAGAQGLWQVDLPWIPVQRLDASTTYLADRQVRVELKTGAFFEDAYLFAEPMAGVPPAWPAGLTPKSPRFQLEPATLPLDQGFWLGLEPILDAGESGTVAVSLYRYDGEDWSYVGSESRSAGGRSWIGADVKRLSQFALAKDTVPPTVEWVSPPAAVAAISSAGTGSAAGGTRPLLRARVKDTGAGFREDDLTFLIDGRPVPSEWDPDTGDLRYTPRQSLAPGRHVMIAQAKDRAGLVTRRERTLTVR